MGAEDNRDGPSRRAKENRGVNKTTTVANTREDKRLNFSLIMSKENTLGRSAKDSLDKQEASGM